MNAPATTPDGDSTAVLSVKIDNLTQTVEHLRDDLKAQSETYVRKDVYEGKVLSLDREIVDIKKQLDRQETRKPTGIAISALVLSALLAAVNIIQAIAK